MVQCQAISALLLFLWLWVLILACNYRNVLIKFMNGDNKYFNIQCSLDNLSTKDCCCFSMAGTCLILAFQLHAGPLITWYLPYIIMNGSIKSINMYYGPHMYIVNLFYLWDRRCKWVYVNRNILGNPLLSLMSLAWLIEGLIIKKAFVCFHCFNRFN